MAKKTLFAGIDVSKVKLDLALHGSPERHQFDNDRKGHKALISFLKKRGGKVTVTLEATGVYGLDIALALHTVRRFEVCYLNPARSRAFARVDNLSRAKTDKVDCGQLAKMGAVLDLQRWTPPATDKLELRSVTRRVRALIDESTREKNRLNEVRCTGTSSNLVIIDLEEHITQLETRIAKLRKAAIAHARSHPDLDEALDIIVSVRGIAEPSGIEILGAYACLPNDLSTRQLTAQAGLDPKPKQSGMIDSPRHISKMGSRHLRAAMFMPAINTVKHCPEVRRFFEHLTENRQKKPLVAYTAVARKLLCTIHGMLRTKTTFDATRFYNPHEKMERAA